MRALVFTAYFSTEGIKSCAWLYIMCVPRSVSVAVALVSLGGRGVATLFSVQLVLTTAPPPPPPSQIVKRKGVTRGLYAGLSAAFLRQWLYGSCRMGIFSQLLNSYVEENRTEQSRTRGESTVCVLCAMCRASYAACRVSCVAYMY